MYDYHEAMKSDIEEYIYKYCDLNELKEMGFERAYETLESEMWEADEVTGNTNYYGSEESCSNYVGGNLKLAFEALEEFGGYLGMIPHDNPAQYLDATIRCYLLGGILYNVLKEIIKWGE